MLDNKEKLKECFNSLLWLKAAYLDQASVSWKSYGNAEPEFLGRAEIVSSLLNSYPFSDHPEFRDHLSIVKPTALDEAIKIMLEAITMIGHFEICTEKEIPDCQHGCGAVYLIKGFLEKHGEL